MAQAAAMMRTGGWLAALHRRLIGRLLRDARYTVPVCILLICGSFAATAALQMQRDRSHALEIAAQYGGRSAHDLAAVTAAALDRLAAAGTEFAAHPGAVVALSGLRNIAVFDAGGARRAILHPDSAMTPPPSSASRTVFAYGPDGALGFSSGGMRIVVLFDSTALAPTSMLDHAALLPAHGAALVTLSSAPSLGWASAAVPGWPLTASVAVSRDYALASWMGSLPLYLFVIIGPAAAGAWLAVLFVGAFERHAKATRAVKSLKSMRPVEARLMVRLAQAERGAVEALRAKSEFIAHMSHELRTPLNAVIGFSEVIAQGYYGPAGHPKYSEYARDIGEAGRNLHAKIGDILEFANIEAGRFPLKEEAVDMAALAQACVAEHQGRAFNRRIRLEIGFCRAGQRARRSAGLDAHPVQHPGQCAGLYRRRWARDRGRPLRGRRGRGADHRQRPGLHTARNGARGPGLPALRPGGRGDRGRAGIGHRHGTDTADGGRGAAGKRRGRRRDTGCQAAPVVRGRFGRNLPLVNHG